MSNIQLIVDASLFDDLTPEGIVAMIKSIDLIKEENKQLKDFILWVRRELDSILGMDSDMFAKVRQLRELQTTIEKKL